MDFRHNRLDVADTLEDATSILGHTRAMQVRGGGAGHTGTHGQFI